MDADQETLRFKPGFLRELKFFWDQENLFSYRVQHST